MNHYGESSISSKIEQRVCRSKHPVTEAISYGGRPGCSNNINVAEKRRGMDLSLPKKTEDQTEHAIEVADQSHEKIAYNTLSLLRERFTQYFKCPGRLGVLG